VTGNDRENGGESEQNKWEGGLWEWPLDSQLQTHKGLAWEELCNCTQDSFITTLYSRICVGGSTFSVFTLTPSDCLMHRRMRTFRVMTQNYPMYTIKVWKLNRKRDQMCAECWVSTWISHKAHSIQAIVNISVI
jgi:hypothetical protein